MTLIRQLPRQRSKSSHKLKSATGQRFAAGVLLYDGDAIATFGENLYAVPISCLWEAS